jgi:hypothetical protein
MFISFDEPITAIWVTQLSSVIFVAIIAAMKPLNLSFCYYFDLAVLITAIT